MCSSGLAENGGRRKFERDQEKSMMLKGAYARRRYQGGGEKWCRGGKKILVTIGGSQERSQRPSR